MTASRRNTPRSSAKAASDLMRVDAHVIQPHEYDELPDLSDLDPAEGSAGLTGKPRGRPALGDKARRLVSLRLDPAAVDAFKATGSGWQTRINAIIVKAAKRL